MGTPLSAPGQRHPGWGAVARYCWRRSVIIQYEGFAFAATASAWQEALQSSMLDEKQCPGGGKIKGQSLRYSGGVANFTETGITVMLQQVLETRFRVVIVLAPANYVKSVALQADGMMGHPTSASCAACIAVAYAACFGYGLLRRGSLCP